MLIYFITIWVALEQRFSLTVMNTTCQVLTRKNFLLFLLNIKQKKTVGPW